MDALPDSRGRFGLFGGKYVPETLMSLLEELEQAYREAQADPAFHTELQSYLTALRRSSDALYFASRLSERFGWLAHFLKREDLNHHRCSQNQQCPRTGTLDPPYAETSHHR